MRKKHRKSEEISPQVTILELILAPFGVLFPGRGRLFRDLVLGTLPGVPPRRLWWPFGDLLASQSSQNAPPEDHFGRILHDFLMIFVVFSCVSFFSPRFVASPFCCRIPVSRNLDFLPSSLLSFLPFHLFTHFPS